ncbi:SNF2 domain-containing protein CLASSY 4-like [Salvia divinorum]|uniref:SNF2 domain-containing protein CLASSY 4-like n=1 Tax=Salvia divinorum TaxID=28513 RepID=A0ABD1FTG2_SALDI
MEVTRRRTRLQWDVFFQQEHHTRKQKQKKKNDDAVQTLNTDYMEQNHCVETLNNDDMEQNHGVETLNTDAQVFFSASQDDAVEAFQENDAMNVDHDDASNSGEDSDVSGEDSDEPASESEEEDDDYIGGESSVSESSDDEYGVAEKTRRREHPRKETHTEKVNVVVVLDDDDDQSDQTSETRSHEHKSDSEVFTGNSNERSVVRLRKRTIIVNMENETETETLKEKDRVKKVIMGKKRSHSAKHLNFTKILDSINAAKDKQCNTDDQPVPENALPLRFRFEDEVVLPPHKSEHEKFIDELFHELELGLRQTDCADLHKAESDELKTTVEIDESCCKRWKHQAILDEQIGIICKNCDTVIMDIKHVLPPFHVPTWERRDKRYYRDEFQSSYLSEIQFGGTDSCIPGSTSCMKGTVWDLVPGVKEDLYPHQQEGFEFMWRNIAGGTVIENLKQTPADDARGCIISHAPGTGKTRLTIVFLQSFLKLYPSCSPLIIAPKGMLLTWEAEFKKWNFNVAFLNLNKKELSGVEKSVATGLLGQDGSGVFNQDCIRLLKLYSWERGGSVLGVSYKLFEKLAGERDGKRKQHKKIGELLLERPGLLVLDEGHTPRNHKSLMWKVLTKVSTQRRIILSGTPFQNSLRELFNTLCIVNPKFADQGNSVRGPRWKNLVNSSDISSGTMLRMRDVLEPYVHVYKGTVLEEKLPGLRHTLVFLHPTKSQQPLLERACKEKIMFNMVWMVSLVSVHPSINAVAERYSTRREEIATDIDAGVKARFLLKLIHFADALGERVLIFSQFIDSLVFIKEQLESIYSWNEGREVLFIHGHVDDKKRQESISCFNDETSKAKVLLASERACSEGINLTGASRVVLLDTVWNPSVEKQAISRAYRLGQRRVVHVYRLFTSGIEVRQYAQQNLKERISRWIFSLGEEHSANSRAVSEDKVLEAMRNLENFNQIFEKVISQPKESDLIKTFGLEGQK